ncbi:hypothetical protein [Methylicorpusculum sp.]|uniref:hypothetical protein n=1 Tax=Methylicorpusculum sp. TaxID=2713644 RepID=UPI00271BC6ED|nr:hypothetical protein [Methylicorpusculum sp.]MDO8845382.1 hypothetical protein [Methylicorpusculum sp.]MDO9238988.1 hypothetical protein [Methylicorpusculum sp.]MDP2178842.1 hypothetical protein [Methylicorpusculum sp.]MDP3529087.1 hypothetical protein [Methylicorpusculum sp.]MDZ4152487.1 hypothetical protein [Methylicorpusculum sp.]
MFYHAIKIGTKVRPFCEDALPDVTTDSIGEVIMFKEIGRNRRDFYTIIRWDNGTESFLNARFFFKAVTVVEEVVG